jgi:hypothetical protein
MESQIKELKLLNNNIYYFINENYDVTEKQEDYVDFNTLYDEYNKFSEGIGIKGKYKINIFGKELIRTFVNKITSDRRSISGYQKRVYTGLKKKSIQGSISWEE